MYQDIAGLVPDRGVIARQSAAPLAMFGAVNAAKPLVSLGSAAWDKVRRA